jgi:hypothetical protein
VAAGRPGNRVRGVVPADGTFLPLLAYALGERLARANGFARKRAGGQVDEVVMIEEGRLRRRSSFFSVGMMVQVASGGFLWTEVLTE